MNVAEIIKILNKLPQHLPVVMPDMIPITQVVLCKQECVEVRFLN